MHNKKFKAIKMYPLKPERLFWKHFPLKSFNFPKITHRYIEWDLLWSVLAAVSFLRQKLSSLCALQVKEIRGRLPDISLYHIKCFSRKKRGEAVIVTDWFCVVLPVLFLQISFCLHCQSHKSKKGREKMDY